MRRTFLWIFVAVGVVICSSPSLAQTTQLSGQVTDQQKLAVANAEVRIVDQNTGIERRVKSNDSGYYTAPFLQPSHYKVFVQAPGFDTSVSKDLILNIGQNLALNFQMRVGSTQQEVTVEGGSSLLNTSDATVGTVVDRHFVENIPLNGRSLQSLISAIPGVLTVPNSNGPGFSGEFSVNGQRSEGNYFTVDGVSANTGQTATTSLGVGSGYSGSVPELTVLGTTQSMMSIDALQEFRGSTSTYSAEYGRSSGGQFSFLTRSGTSRLHGAAFEYLRNAVFDANAFFNKFTPGATFDRPKENQNDFGGTLSGPVIFPGWKKMDTTFFFFSYEGLRLRVPKAASMTLVPTLALRASVPSGMQPFLNAFPVPGSGSVDRGNGMATYYSSFSTPSSIDATSVRIDHDFKDRWKLFARFSYAPSSTTGRYASNLAVETPTTNLVKTLTGGLDTTVTVHQVNSLRLNYTWNDNTSIYRSTSFGGATVLTVSSVPGLDAKSQINFNMTYDTPYPLLTLQNQATRQTQFNVVDGYSVAAGRHNLRFGADYRVIHTSVTLPSTWEVVFFTAQSQVTTGKPASGQARRFYGAMEPVYHNLSFYGQDQWTVNSHLSLSYGLRWDFVPPPTDATGNSPYTVNSTDPLTTVLSPKSTPLWKPSHTNFAPRLGISYTAHQTDGRRTVLRAGWGLFYDMGNPSASGGYLGIGVAAIAALNGVSYPFTQAQIDAIGQPSVAAPYSATIYGFDPNLKTPRGMQYNAAVEQEFGPKQTFTLSYIGNSGDRLLAALQYYPSRAGNANFSNSWPLILTTNQGIANYNALQARIQRSLAHGVQVLFSYTWSHGIDNATSNYTLYTLQRATSDSDVRHNFQATFVAQIPGRYHQRLLETTLGDWALDGRISARSALPLDINQTGTVDTATAQQRYLHPNRIASQPLYLPDASVPGGRKINVSAFTPVTSEGNSGRNIARAFGVAQVDLTLHKDFALYDSWKLQFRAEAFNIVNKTNLGAVYTQLTPSGSSWTSASASNFGKAYNTLNDQLGGLTGIYQQGGPRSLQLALKLQF